MAWAVRRMTGRSLPSGRARILRVSSVPSTIVPSTMVSRSDTSITTAATDRSRTAASTSDPSSVQITSKPPRRRRMASTTSALVRLSSTTRTVCKMAVLPDDTPTVAETGTGWSPWAGLVRPRRPPHHPPRRRLSPPYGSESSSRGRVMISSTQGLGQSPRPAGDIARGPRPEAHAIVISSSWDSWFASGPASPTPSRRPWSWSRSFRSSSWGGASRRTTARTWRPSRSSTSHGRRSVSPRRSPSSSARTAFSSRAPSALSRPAPRSLRMPTHRCSRAWPKKVSQSSTCAS